MASLYRALIAVGGLVYLVWWFLVELVLPGSFNPIGSRLAVVLSCWTLFAASFASRRLAQHLALSLYCCLWLVTLHYFYLFFHNQADINWVVGSYITVIAASACLQSTAAALSYSLWVLFLSLTLSLFERTLLRTVFLPGMVTILAFAYGGLRARLRHLAALRKYEQDRILYEASQRAIHMREEFLSIASHELKTPLTNVKLRTQMAMRALKKGDSRALEPDQMRSFIELTDRQADQLTRLVEEMLDVSKISAGQLGIHRTELDLTELVREVASTFDASLRQSASSLTIESSGVTRIHADRFRMEQVISNLLSNAIKYGNRKPIKIRVEQRSTEIRLSVEDQGVGLSPQDQERIFQRFERAISSKKISGLGLGLFISKHIVDAHGGRLEVASQVGRGATFTVTLPSICRQGDE